MARRVRWPGVQWGLALVVGRDLERLLGAQMSALRCLTSAVGDSTLFFRSLGSPGPLLSLRVPFGEDRAVLERLGRSAQAP